jgi:hypothetical protein
MGGERAGNRGGRAAREQPDPDETERSPKEGDRGGMLPCRLALHEQLAARNANQRTRAPRADAKNEDEDARGPWPAQAADPSAGERRAQATGGQRAGDASIPTSRTSLRGKCARKGARGEKGGLRQERGGGGGGFVRQRRIRSEHW